MKEIGSKAPTSKSGKKSYARVNQGIMGAPIFTFKLDHIIPCNLHCGMGIIRKLLALLVSLIGGKNQQIDSKIEAVFAEIKLTLFKPKEGEQMAMDKRVKKSKFNRPELLRILKNKEKFLQVLLDSAGDNREMIDFATRVQLVWESFHKLYSLAVQPKVAITQREWQTMARDLGRQWVSAFGESEVTTYLHIFIYHFGFFLEKYSSIERFANFAIEGTVGKTKKNLQNATSGFKSTEGQHSAAAQQLEVSFRNEKHALSGLLKDPRKHREGKKNKRDWATEMLEVHPDLKKYIPQ